MSFCCGEVDDDEEERDDEGLAVNFSISGKML
jgi:hypothetical protein